MAKRKKHKRRPPGNTMTIKYGGGAGDRPSVTPRPDGKVDVFLSDENIIEEVPRIAGLLPHQWQDFNRSIPRNKGVPIKVKDSVSTFPVHDFNANLAASLLSDRTTVLFADEVLASIRSKSDVYEAISRSPRPVPPFPSMFIEGSLIKGLPVSYIKNNPVGGFGLFVATHDLDDPSSKDRVKDVQFSIDRDKSRGMRPLNDWTPRFSVETFLYVAGLNGLAGPVGMVAYALNRQYEILRGLDPVESDNQWWEPVLWATLIAPPPWWSLPDGGFIRKTLMYGVSFVIKSVAMMNCSNIETVYSGKTNEDVGEKRRRRDRLAWVKYHVLKLRVGKELREVELGNGHGKPTPLHMVRGHFRDYSKGTGLFGHLSGEKYAHVWVPPFVRGKKEDGVVVKDYGFQSDQPHQSADQDRQESQPTLSQ